MAIINRTPDSFFDGGATFDDGAAMAAVDQAVADGAALVDIGGVKAGVGRPVDVAGNCGGAVSLPAPLAVARFLGMVVGGVGWLPGSFVGAAFIVFIPNVAESISKGLSGAVFGVLLFVVIFLLPHGARQIALVCQHMIGKLKKPPRKKQCMQSND